MNRMPIAKLILAAAMLASVFSCSVKVDPTAVLPVDEDGISLVFSCDDDFLVKSEDRDGVDALNENLLTSVEYFLYPVGGTDNDAVLHGYLTSVRKDAPYSLAVTDDVLSARLCPNNAKYFCVYAIANHSRIVAQPASGQEEDLSGTSVPELEELTRDLDMNGGSVLTPQSNFLMATEGVVTSPQIKRHQTTIATVSVPLKRVAAKLTIYVRTDEYTTIENTVVINGVSYTRNEVWRPRTDEMQIYLVNGAKTGKVSGAPVSNSELIEYQPFEFDTGAGVSHNYSTFEDTDPDPNEVNWVEQEKTGTFHPCKSPFYTYPESWEFGSESEPYLKLMIPWDRDAGSNDDLTWGSMSKQYYYRVYCPGSALDGTHAQFLRNNWYEIFLNVSILGSELEGGALEIAGNYYVVDWQERDTGSGSGGQGSGINDTDKEAEIKGARYLFVNDTEYDLYNINDLMIPYVTSDPCEIVDATAKRWNFSGSSKQEVTTTDLASWGITLELQTTATGAHIHFNRVINNDLSGTAYDVSEYTVTFTLRQKDATNYEKDITIRQDPAIMIDMENNDGDSNNHHGRTYVNNGEKLSYVGNTNGTSTGNNTNFNMVIIETTVLPSDSKYMLGDPRTLDVDNIYYNRANQDNYNATYETWPNTTDAQRVNTNNNWSANTNSIQGTTRRLSYYYPVRRDTDADNIIAPKFRVASSHGATNALSYANAFRRCASYQEAGYPAGRWRLPTVAEVTYAMQLNAAGKITRLFGSSTNGDESYYWCNSGYIMVYDGTDDRSKTPPEAHPGVTTLNENVYVRCVYDDWYWDGMKLNGTDVSKVPVGTFTWGDMPR